MLVGIQVIELGCYILNGVYGVAVLEVGGFVNDEFFSDLCECLVKLIIFA